MVRAFDFHKSSSFNFKKIFELTNRHHHGQGAAGMGDSGEGIEVSPPDSQSGSPLGGESPNDGGAPTAGDGAGPAASKSEKHKSKFDKTGRKSGPPSDMDLMKEKFARLLLGEDMSGGGKGVSSALALSNAITNLAASIFGEQRKLEPMSPDRRARWKKECDWLLSVTDYIVELVPSKQQLPDGTFTEVMASRQRADLMVNIPALRKLDNMLIDCLDNFKGQNEYWYIDPKDANESEKNSQRNWWIPTVKVPNNGLSDVTRRWLLHQKESVNQVLKAALAINAMLLTEMEIPESYIEALPKNGRASLGDSIYKGITDDGFDPEQLLATMDLSSELKVLDLMNKIEASVVIWQRKMVHKDSKSGWGSAVSLEKREIFEERAETILLILKHQFPGLPQSSLDISKIQFNKDVGLAVLESYSRVLESLASAVMCRIDDVIFADDAAQNSISAAELKMKKQRTMSACSFARLQSNADAAAQSMTLLDFMGWTEHGEDGNNLKSSSGSGGSGDFNNWLKEEQQQYSVKTSSSTKPPTGPQEKRLLTAYLQRLVQRHESSDQ